MITLGEAIRKTTEHFQNKGITSARLDAELLFASALNLKRIDIYLKFDKPLLDAELSLCRELVRRRSAGEPVAYILGYKDFYENRFSVNSHVLIPRPDSELIVEKGIEFLKSLADREKFEVLDLGTGSGCLGLSVLSYLNNSYLEGVDVSSNALKVAEENSRSLSLQDRAHFSCIDILSDSERLAQQWAGRFDLVVANPPYIALDDQRVEQDVKKFEPHLALFADNEGLGHYPIWAKLASAVLRPQGLSLFEIGADQGQSVRNIFASLKVFSTVEVLKDYSGHDRVVMARRA